MKKLIGSEKQVKWAEDIRKEMLQSAEDIIKGDYQEILNFMASQSVTIDEILEKVKGSKIEKQVLGLKDILSKKARIEQQEEAKWFIDNRYNFSWI